MPRMAFSLLLCLLLLQPPGLCLCRLADYIAGPTEGERGSDEEAIKSAPVKKCRCCRVQNHNTSASSPKVSAADNNSPDREPGQEHAPGCPASPDYVLHRGTLADSGTGVAKSFLIATALVEVAAANAETATAVVVAFAPALSRSAPLFLLCCQIRC